MATRIEDLSSQVDGVTDVFTTLSEMEPGTVTIGYNGQVYPPGVNIDSFPSPNQVKLSFVPQDSTDPDFDTKLMVIYEELVQGSIEDIVGSSTPPGFA